MAEWAMKRAWLLLIGLLIISACGGGGAGLSGSGGGGTVTDAQRASAIQAVNQKFEQVHAGGGTVASQNQALATYMGTLPEFEAVGVNSDDDCTWGRFKDGRILVVGNNRFPDRRPVPPFPWGPSPKATFVSKSKNARLMHAFGANFNQLQQPIADMTRYLQKDGLFTIVGTPEGKARLTDLRAVTGDAFWYINAHGGKGTTKAGEELFVVASSTPYDIATENQADVKFDWDNNRLCYYTGLTGDTVGGVETSATTYAINRNFVAEYMSFSPNAIVFLNVCFTGNNHLQVGRFRDAILNKGAGVVMGWTQLCKSSSAFDASRYFVDRLAASNDFQKENPDQRAFAVNEIMADMANKGKDMDGPSQLVATYKLGVSNVSFRPTIRLMYRDEENDYLVLTGEFGSEAGEVRVNGVPGTLVGAWDNANLNVRIPATGNGSEGPVVVEVHGKKSKERFLTSWRGTFTFTYVGTGPGNTLREDCVANLHIRADVDQYRDVPGGPLLDQPIVPFAVASDSTLTWSCSGTVVDNIGIVTQWSGGGSPPLVRTVIAGPQNAWTCAGFYNPATRQFLMDLVNGGPKTVFARGFGTGPALPQSSGAYLKLLNADWTAPSYDIPLGDATTMWSKFNVTWPPPNVERRP